MTYTVGIDPGLSGAIAVYDSDINVVTQTCEMPTMKISKGKGSRNVIDVTFLYDILDNLAFFYKPEIVVLEAVGPRHKDTALTAFTFGEGYGILRGGIMRIFDCRLELVPPANWKRHMMVGTLDDDIKKRAEELLPCQSHLWRGPRGGFLDGIAEASMLALYGEWVLNNKIPQFAKATKR